MRPKQPDQPDNDPIFDALCHLLDVATAAVRADNLAKAEQVTKRVHDIAERLPKREPDKPTIEAGT